MLTCTFSAKCHKRFRAVTDSMIMMCTSIRPITEKAHVRGFFYMNHSAKRKSQLSLLDVQRKRAQAAWMSLLQRGLKKGQRKAILSVVADKVAPWFLKAELLMDFLTDSFDAGGSTSLMALSGLFQLVQEKNLDYPHFYDKLYHLLDAELMHSKHRSRSFRLLNEILASTHLPAVLVASFIKRLSRLCLHSPPAGIVIVLPWTYNMLRGHPTCTSMIHRETTQTGECTKSERTKFHDPFSMDQKDPLLTHGIDSSLWELESLQSHYHPNVATVARIISDQFTKQAYVIEDFLDHTYGSVGHLNVHFCPYVSR